MKKKVLSLSVAAALATTFAACSDEDPLATNADGREEIVVGSANFPESQIIGELYAQALEQAGFQVRRQANIGARDVYLTALEKGEIDVIAEYSGNAAQYYQAGNEAADGEELKPGASAEEVYSSLEAALPEGVSVGEKAAAESKDSYRVSPTLARQHQLTTLDDLKSSPRKENSPSRGILNSNLGPTGPMGWSPSTICQKTRFLSTPFPIPVAH